jgi:hypothetical protein
VQRSAKEIRIESIDSHSARKIIARYHYSGKSTQNSQIHFGVFIDGILEGALQFGPSIDKRRMAQSLGCGFNETLELNRMAFGPMLPKNSESRALSICLRILRKRYPHLKVIISFADACQCGDGTIYRAAGFRLDQINRNKKLLRMPDGSIVADKTLNDRKIAGGRSATALAREMGAKPIEGYQLRYLYFFDRDFERASSHRFISFDQIPEGVRMYLGKRKIGGESI